MESSALCLPCKTHVRVDFYGIGKARSYRMNDGIGLCDGMSPQGGMGVASNCDSSEQLLLIVPKQRHRERVNHDRPAEVGFCLIDCRGT